MDPISNSSISSVPTPEVPKKSVLPIVLIVLLIVTLVGAAGYFFYQNQNLKKEIVAQTLKTQVTPTVVQPSPALDLKADWKTFTSKYGYSVKYPQNYEIKTGDWMEFGQPFGIQKNDEAVIRSNAQTKPKQAGPYGDSISLRQPENNSQQLSIEQWVRQKLQSKDYPAEIITHDIVIDNIKSIQAYRIDFPYIQYVFVPLKEKIYTLVHAPEGTELEITAYQKIFDQILSTFKFTE